MNDFLAYGPNHLKSMLQYTLKMSSFKKITILQIVGKHVEMIKIIWSRKHKVDRSLLPKIKWLSNKKTEHFICWQTQTSHVLKIRHFHINYGHDEFSIGLLKDSTPHVEIQLMIYGAKHPFLWNHAGFFHLLRPMYAQKYIKLNFCIILPHLHLNVD